jgi:hypothetical protein
MRPAFATRPTFLPPLPLAAAVVAVGVYTVWGLGRLVERFAGGQAGVDFSYNLSAARVGLQHGWAAVYDRRLYGEVTHYGAPLSYANLPAVAWLTIPLTGLPFRTGLALWMAPLVLLLLGSWWLAAPGGGWERLAHLVPTLAAGPIVFGLYLGQLSLAVMGLLAAHWWLVGRGRPVLAGVALGLACLKPQDVLLVPVALALTGRWRCWAAWAATVATLAIAMALALGPAGVAAYRDQLLRFSLDQGTTAYTLWRQLPGWLPALPLRTAIAALALVPALFEGGPRYGRAVAAAVAGSLLVTPYLNFQDLGLLVLAGWLVLGTSPPRWTRWAMVPSYVAVAYPAGGVPPMSVAGFWVIALSLLAVWPWLVARPGR